MAGIVEPAVPTTEIKSESEGKLVNVYWGISYSFADIGRRVLLSDVGSIKLETDKREYRVTYVDSYDDLHRQIMDPTLPVVDIVIVNDYFKLQTAKESALLDEKSDERKQARKFLEKAKNQESGWSLAGLISKLISKLSWRTPKKTETHYNGSKEMAMDYLALRISDPKRYCDGLFKSVQTQAAKLSRLMSNVNPDAKLVIVNTNLGGVRSGNEELAEQMIGLYREIIYDLPKKYRNVHIFSRTETLFFDDQNVEQTLMSLDDLLDGRD